MKHFSRLIILIGLIPGHTLEAGPTETKPSPVEQLPSVLFPTNVSGWTPILVAADRDQPEARQELSRFRRRIAQGITPDSPEMRSLEQLQAARAELLQSQFPDIHPAGNQETFGTLLFQRGQHEEVLTTTLREAGVLKPPAMLLLRILYLYPVEGYPEHDGRIFDYFQRTAGEGSLRSQLVLAEIYQQGAGVTPDLKKAVSLLETNLLEEAQQLLGAIYLKAGQMNKAQTVVKAAAERDETWAHYEYGVFLRDAGDYTNAVQHFQQAVQNDPKHWLAMVNLGQCYVEGWGVKADQRKGFELYKRAADESDDPVAAYVTGILYLKGTGVVPSEPDAVRYLKKAAALGYEKANEVLKNLAEPKTAPVQKKA